MYVCIRILIFFDKILKFYFCSGIDNTLYNIIHFIYTFHKLYFSIPRPYSYVSYVHKLYFSIPGPHSYVSYVHKLFSSYSWTLFKCFIGLLVIYLLFLDRIHMFHMFISYIPLIPGPHSYVSYVHKFYVSYSWTPFICS